MTENMLFLTELKPEQEQKINNLGVHTFHREDLGEEIEPSDITILVGWDRELGPKLVNDPQTKLKWIHAISAGVDYLPLAEMAAKKILLTNSSGFHAEGISQSVLSYVLYFVRQLDTANENKQLHHWKPQSEQRPQVVKSFTYVVFGTGHIGQEIARLLKAFGATTIGINTTGHPVQYFDQTFPLDQLGPDVFKAEVLINALPLTDETHHYFNGDLFNQFDQIFLFSNVGRGPSVNTTDLLHALDTNQIEHAALDVFEEEPLPAASPLWDYPNVIVTPHMSGIVEHFTDAQFKLIWPNIQSFIQNGQLSINEVNLQKGY